MNHTINICLLPSSEAYDACITLNKFDTTPYNLNSRDYIPHATLVMKTLSDEQIQKLHQEIKNLSLHKQKTNNLGYYAERTEHSGLWTGISIEKTKSIYELQKQILELTKKYEAQIRAPETYAIDDFYEENEIKFYEEDEYLLNDSLHITLGKQDIRNEYINAELSPIISFDKIIIGKIGNYGSVREIMFEYNLN